ncbi:hypothetical protein WJ977_07860 [Achromobacter xylosoxidans]
MGPDGAYRIGLTAISAAAGGNVTGSAGQFLQSAAANYLQALGAGKVKQIADALNSEAARTALQGLVGCAGAAGQGSSCSAAAAGAAASVVLNNLIQGLSGQDAKELTAEQKEARVNLVASLVGASQQHWVEIVRLRLWLPRLRPRIIISGRTPKVLGHPNNVNSTPQLLLAVREIQRVVSEPESLAACRSNATRNWRALA